MAYKNIYHGVDCGAHAEAFARALVRNIRQDVRELPALLADAAYQALSDYCKEQVQVHILNTTRSYMLANGFPPGTVAKVLG